MGCSSSQPEDGSGVRPQAGANSSAAQQNGKDDVDQSGESEAVKRQRRRLSVAPQHVAEGKSSAANSDQTGDGQLTEIETKAKGTLKHAICSRKGVVPYNKNKVNQDRAVLKYAVGDDAAVNLWGVMDGHGEFGHYVAAFVQENLPRCLGAERNLRANPEQAITAAVKVMCDQLAQTDINISFSGSTAVFGVKIEGTLFVANIGDSRCVLCRQQENGNPTAIGLSIDQKPERKSEKARIEQCGGRVEPLPGPPGECGPARVWLADADVPGLAMSRSIGDEVSQTVGVISVPEIVAHQLQPNDIFAIWASDGVWEFISSEDAVAIVWKHRNDLNAAVNALVDESTKAWKREEEVVDDITCIIVKFNEPR